jgi:surfactin synthase thioesterase subunit
MNITMFPGDHFFTQSAQPSLLQMPCDRIFA